MIKSISTTICCLLLSPFAGMAGSFWDGLEAQGFLDLRGGLRTQVDPVQRDTSLAELRGQLQLSGYWGPATVQLRADFLHDRVSTDQSLDLEQGRGWLDLREAHVLFSPASWMDVKLGRQILTWGNGDLLFINDLFPKDWQAFFSGREQDYLKAPSDSAFLGFFPRWATIELSYVPRFDADRYIRGERLSYWNAGLNRIAGRDAIINADAPTDPFENSEWHLRISKTIAGFELAAYGYRGYWKSPAGADRQSGRATFPALDVYGASARGPVGKGLLAAEIGWYRSRDFNQDPTVRPGESRALLAYERELAKNLTGSVQYYIEALNDYQERLRRLPPGTPQPDEVRHLFTMRITRAMRRDNLIAGLFVYASPSDWDGYARPSLRYRWTDHWTISAGANLFFGEELHTFFGQFENNSNAFLAIRYSANLK